MRTIVLDGPMETKPFKRGIRDVVFEKGKPQDFEDDDPFVDECLAMNPDKLTVEQAATYCIPVFREVTRGAGAPARGSKGGEVRSDG